MEPRQARQRPRQVTLIDAPEPPTSVQSRPIAGVCTLASQSLLKRLSDDPAVTDVAVVGPLTTENLGVEKLVRSALHTPTLRFVILCGQEARGHYGGQALQALAEHGVDGDGRIVGARGPRPFLANVGHAAVERFREQVTIVDLIGCEEPDLIIAQLTDCARVYPGPVEREELALVAESPEAYEIRAAYDPYRDWVADPSGFFLVRADRATSELICEHYFVDHQFHVAIRGASAAAVLHTIVQYQLVSRLDHAGYLGRELQKAELALALGLTYEQDEPLRPERGG